MMFFFFAGYNMFFSGSIHNIFSGGIWLDVQASGTNAFAMQNCIESPLFVGLRGLLVHGGWVFSYILLGFLITLMAEVSISVLFRANKFEKHEEQNHQTYNPKN